jgi:hypothetical protein
MKKHAPIFSVLCFLSFLSITSIKAQNNFAYLDTNNVRARVNSNGMLFGDPVNQTASFEVPKNGGVSTIFASNLWFAGVSPDQQLKSAVGTFGQGEDDWFPGPLTTDGAASTTPETMAAYDRVWVANKTQIATHLAYIQAVQNGTNDIDFPNGYAIPSWFLDWPAMGNMAQGQSTYLAPFVDLNGDGLYNPNDLDYPNFPGDQCVYFIMNDKGGVHPSGSEPIGVEVHVMVYAFNAPDGTDLDNTVFVNYHVINRGSQTLTDTYCGIWSDTDLGSGIDDYVGCNVEHSFFYSYNGDAFDEASSSSLGYGANIPVQTIAILGGPFKDVDTIDNGYLFPGPTSGTYGCDGVGTNDNVVDNEELGMCGYTYYNLGGNPVNGDPSAPLHYYNYMKGIWKNGATITYGGIGTGFGTGTTTIPAKYMFPGNSDPWLYGTSGTQVTEWTEVTAGNIAGDRRSLASMGPFTLEPSEEFSIDIAFTAVDTASTGNSPETAAANAVSNINSYFQQNVNDVFFGLTNAVSVQKIPSSATALRVFPNPAQDQLQLNLSGILEVRISNAFGQQVLQLSSNQEIKTLDTSLLSPGIYSLTAFTSKGTHVVKFVKS